MAIRFEAWDLPWGFLRGAEFRQAQADIVTGRVAKRPDRIPVRYLLAANRAGAFYEARQRSWQQPQCRVHRPGPQGPPSGDPTITALLSLTATVTGLARRGPEREP